MQAMQAMHDVPPPRSSLSLGKDPGFGFTGSRRADPNAGEMTICFGKDELFRRRYWYGCYGIAAAFASRSGDTLWLPFPRTWDSCRDLQPALGILEHLHLHRTASHLHQTPHQ